MTSVQAHDASLPSAANPRLAASDPADAGLDGDALERLRGAVRTCIANGRHFGATVLVARGGTIGMNEGIGYTDEAGERAARREDRYWSASLSKAFCAGLITKLIDQGALSLTTRVAEIIREYGVRGKAPTEIRHLLNHTGGCYSGFLPPPPLQWPEMFELEKYVSAVAAQQVLFRPGSQAYYSPSGGYAVLGRIACIVAGKAFPQLMHDEIFGPLGMAGASFGLAIDHPDRVTIRMTDESPGAAETATMQSFNEMLEPPTALPGGGAYATTYDVYRFAEMQRRKGTLDGERLLSPAIVDYATQVSTGDLTNLFWDFGKIDRGVDEFPANFTLFGGYGRGHGLHLNPFGYTASARTFGAVGSGSTMYMVDPERELVFVFLAAGLTEGLGHFQDICRLGDLALAACT